MCEYIYIYICEYTYIYIYELYIIFIHTYSQSHLHVLFPSSDVPVLIEIRDTHEGEEEAQQQREAEAAHELLVEVVATVTSVTYPTDLKGISTKTCQTLGKFGGDV